MDCWDRSILPARLTQRFLLHSLPKDAVPVIPIANQDIWTTSSNYKRQETAGGKFIQIVGSALKVMGSESGNTNRCLEL